MSAWTFSDDVTHLTGPITDRMITDEPERYLALASRNFVQRIIYFCVGGIGIASNTFVIFILVKYRSSMLKQVPNIYIMNQSLIDGLTSALLVLAYLFEDDGRKLSGSADRAYCRWWLSRSPLWAMIVSSSANLVALTIERYLAVVKPIWHKTKVTRKVAVCSLPFIWVSGLLIHSTYVIPSTDVADGACWVVSFFASKTIFMLGGVYIIVSHFLLPVAVFIFCYSRMALVLRGKVQPADSQPNPGEGGGESSFRSKARKNIIKTLAIVTAFYVVCWCPNMIYYFLYSMGLGYPYIDFSSQIYHVTVILTFMNSTINPFIYTVKYKQFQICVYKVFGVTSVAIETSNATGSTVTAK